MITAHIPQILSVEDSPADARLIAELIRLAHGSCSLHFVTDGAEALDYLYRRGAYWAAPRPDLILLDLNLPGIDGREVLKAIKDDPALRYLPVVVLSSSASEEDIVGAYDLRASCYIVKPVDIDSFDEILHQLQAFWLSTVELPRAG